MPSGAPTSADPAVTDYAVAALTTTSGRTLSLWLRGDFDLATRDRLVAVTARFAERCITDHRTHRTHAGTAGELRPDAVVDTGGVRFIDAASLGVLVRLHTVLAEAGISLRIRRPTAMLRRVSAICDFDGVLGLDPAPVSAATLPGESVTYPAGRDRPAMPDRGHLELTPRADAPS